MNTSRCYLAIKTQVNVHQKTQCLPRRLSAISRELLLIDQSTIHVMQRLQAFKYELMPNGESEFEVKHPVPVVTSAIGIDVRITRFAALSDGKGVVPLKSFKKHKTRLKRYECAMSSKVKFSKNWHSELSGVWAHRQRRCGRRNEYIGAGTPRCSLWRGRVWPCA